MTSSITPRRMPAALAHLLSAIAISALSGCTVQTSSGGGGGTTALDLFTDSDDDLLQLEDAVALFPEDGDMLLVVGEEGLGSAVYYGTESADGTVTPTGLSIDLGFVGIDDGRADVTLDDQQRPTRIDLSTGRSMTYQYGDSGTFDYALADNGLVVAVGFGLDANDDSLLSELDYDDSAKIVPTLRTFGVAALDECISIASGRLAWSACTEMGSGPVFPPPLADEVRADPQLEEQIMVTCIFVRSAIQSHINNRTYMP